jgi:hypothetical protein
MTTYDSNECHPFPWAQAQLDDHGNMLIVTDSPVPIGTITDPADGVYEFDQRMGPLVIVAETTEAEWKRRAAKYGLRTAFPHGFRDCHFYLAKVE